MACGGPATHLIFSMQPGGAETGQLLNPQPVVEAVDDQGNVDGSYSQIVTLTIGDNPGGGLLSGNAAVAAIGGVATYTDLSIDQPGVGYTLVANGDAQPTLTRDLQPANALPSTESAPFDITLQAGPAPASCDTIYGVVDANSNSRFFSVDSFMPHTLTGLGGVHSGYNFEGIEIDPLNGDIYATTATSNRHGQKGMIYKVDGLTGALTPAVSTGFKDVEGLAFRPSDGALWAWVDGKGLILMDVTLPFPATLVVPSQRKFEALAWNNAGDKLYLAEKNKLWTWDPSTLAFSLVASNLPGPVLGLDVRPSTATCCWAWRSSRRSSSGTP